MSDDDGFEERETGYEASVFCGRIAGDGDRGRRVRSVDMARNLALTTPRVGSIVHYVSVDLRPEWHYAAIVTHVHTDACLNLMCFTKGLEEPQYVGYKEVVDTGLRRSVQFKADGSWPNSWHWPEG